MARRCHGGIVDRAHGSPIPFGIVWSFREKGEQAVVRLEARSLAALVRLELRQGSFLEGEVGVQVRLRRLDRFMTEPQRDRGAVDAGLQQFQYAPGKASVCKNANEPLNM
jgi:hypothetical protein